MDMWTIFWVYAKIVKKIVSFVTTAILVAYVIKGIICKLKIKTIIWKIICTVNQSVRKSNIRIWKVENVNGV